MPKSALTSKPRLTAYIGVPIELADRRRFDTVCKAIGIPTRAEGVRRALREFVERHEQVKR